jgi:hypothetical protein
MKGRPVEISVEAEEVDDGSETASARRVASRSAHVDDLTILGEVERREARKEAQRSRCRRCRRDWLRQSSKEEATWSWAAAEDDSRAAAGSTSGPGMSAGNAKLRGGGVENGKSIGAIGKDAINDADHELSGRRDAGSRCK